MQTNLAAFMRGTPEGREAEAILRKCVHCGFCTATCPTYQVLGDELDGPRGRIYLIKQVLEGSAPTVRTQRHLDRCLTCRSCETTCPSGVHYSRLLDIGRAAVQAQVSRPLWQRFKRHAIGAVVADRVRFGLALRVARALRPVLPGALRHAVPAAPAAPGEWPPPRHRRRMLVLAGCAQSVLEPRINAAAARLLDGVGISLIEAPAAGCCGALRFHLDDQNGGLRDMRLLIDAWWPHVEQGVEAIVMTASGCGITVKDYAHLLAGDEAYRDKARRISAMTRDLTEVVAAALDAGEASWAGTLAPVRAALHLPCTLQHGQSLSELAARVVRAAGFRLGPVPDAHLCCGSAGSYSMLQPALSRELRSRKLAALQSSGPEVILTANIGCLHHLAAATRVPVEHWVVALERRLAAGA